MKNGIVLLATIFYIGCTGSTTHHSATPRHHQEPPVLNIHSVYNEEMDMTVLMSDKFSVRHRIVPQSLSKNTDLFLTISAVHQTKKMFRVPRYIGLVFETSLEVPTSLLLLNVRNGRWIKVETERYQNTYIAPVPLPAMERFLESNQNSVVGFLGSREPFIQFGVNDERCRLFKRFMSKLHNVVPPDPDHRWRADLPNWQSFQ